jgi:hypothetical protein
MQGVGRAQPFDGGNFFALMHDCKAQAGIHPSAIHMNRAGAALPVIAAFFRASKSDRFANAIKQRGPRIDT